jgi:hypothetical protein
MIPDDPLLGFGLKLMDFPCGATESLTTPLGLGTIFLLP